MSLGCRETVLSVRRVSLNHVRRQSGVFGEVFWKGWEGYLESVGRLYAGCGEDFERLMGRLLRGCGEAVWRVW